MNIEFKLANKEDIKKLVEVQSKSFYEDYLRTFSVIPECQNLGIGQKALKYIDDVYNDATEWTLITPFKSYRNHHLYEKMGFAKYGEYVHSEVLTMFQYRKQK